MAQNPQKSSQSRPKPHKTSKLAQIGGCKSQNIATELQKVAKHHTDSFNYFTENGLEMISAHLNPLEIHATPQILAQMEEVRARRSLQFAWGGQCVLCEPDEATPES